MSTKIYPIVSQDITDCFSDYDPVLVNEKFHRWRKTPAFLDQDCKDINPQRNLAWLEYCDARDALKEGTHQKIYDFYRYKNKKNKFYNQ